MKGPGLVSFLLLSERLIADSLRIFGYDSDDEYESGRGYNNNDQGDDTYHGDNNDYDSYEKGYESGQGYNTYQGDNTKEAQDFEKAQGFAESHQLKGIIIQKRGFAERFQEFYNILSTKPDAYGSDNVPGMGGFHQDANFFILARQACRPFMNQLTQSSREMEVKIQQMEVKDEALGARMRAAWHLCNSCIAHTNAAVIEGWFEEENPFGGEAKVKLGSKGVTRGDQSVKEGTAWQDAWMLLFVKKFHEEGHMDMDMERLFIDMDEEAMILYEPCAWAACARRQTKEVFGFLGGTKANKCLSSAGILVPCLFIAAHERGDCPRLHLGKGVSRKKVYDCGQTYGRDTHVTDESFAWGWKCQDTPVNEVDEWRLNQFYDTEMWTLDKQREGRTIRHVEGAAAALRQDAERRKQREQWFLRDA